MDFRKKTLGRIASQTKPLHDLLNSYSESGGNRNKAELAALSVLLTCADDISPSEKRYSFGKVSDGIKQERIIFAAISFFRDDIVFLSDTCEERPLKLNKLHDSGLTKVSENSDVSITNRYNGRAWTDDRIKAIKCCVKQGANIISLSEFDYPPQLSEDNEDEHARRYSKEIQNIINSAQQPVFLIAGSRHESVEEKGGITVKNYAKIFTNDALKETTVPPPQLPIDHEKIVPAQKMGEQLTPNRTPKVSFYETPIGRIGVLVCIDAYSPNIILSITHSQIEDAKIDYLIVPSYNNSSKFYYACQSLSLISGTVVLLIDGCRLSLSQRRNVELFIDGRSISDIVKDHESEDVCAEKPHDFDEHVKIWDLNLEYIRKAKSKIPLKTSLLKRLLHRH